MLSVCSAPLPITISQGHRYLRKEPFALPQLPASKHIYCAKGNSSLPFILIPASVVVQEVLFFFFLPAAQEKPGSCGRLSHIIPPDQRPAVEWSLHTEQTPSVLPAERVYSNRHSKTPANTQQSTTSAANERYQINQLPVSSTVPVTLGPSVSAEDGKDREEGTNTEKVAELNVNLIQALAGAMYEAIIEHTASQS